MCVIIYSNVSVHCHCLNPHWSRHCSPAKATDRVAVRAKLSQIEQERKHIKLLLQQDRQASSGSTGSTSTDRPIMAPLPAVRAAGPVRQPAVPSIILPGMVPVPADYQPLSGDTVHLSVDVAETALREAGSDSSPQVISLSPASPVDASAGAGSAQRPAGAAIASSVSEDSKDQPTTVISLRPVLPSIRERVHGLLAGSVPIPPGTGIAQVAPVISGSFPWEAPPRASSETTTAGASA